MPTNIIAGVGSRETPLKILDEMTRIGQWCKENHIWVRSGRAPGADTAFEHGAQEFCIVYLPWPTFGEKLCTGAKICNPTNWEQLRWHAAQFHPAWDRLKDSVRKLIARDSCQVLGLHLNDPVKAVVCWTKDGGPTGGTGQAIRIARANRIPVLNMYFPEFSTAGLVTIHLKELIK